MIPTLATAFLTVLVPADVYVDGNASCATGTGTELDPVCTIQEGLALAMDGDTIRIAPGTYFENIAVNSSVELLGTGGAEVTILDGSMGTGSVVIISITSDVIIDGLTITGGSALGGGAVFASGDLTLRNSTVTGNEAFGFLGGGAIFTQAVYSPTVIVEDSRILENISHDSGGAFQVTNSTLIVRRSEIRGNMALNSGGDIFGVSGGGIFAAGSTVQILDSTLDGNVAEGGQGGALHGNSGVDLTIEGSTFSNNSAGTGGGGISVSGNFVIRNSTLSGNLATGGAFSGNGGGLAVGSSITGELSNVTITDNTVFGYGGGVSSSTQIAVHNSIIAGNNAISLVGGDVDVSGSFDSIGFNLIGQNEGGGFTFFNGVNGNQVGTPAAPLDPLLGPLQDNGGPTETHALLPGSPALDLGDPVNFEPIDQRGEPRPQTNGPDIGAFEADGILRDLCNGDGGDQAGCSACPCGNEAPPGTIGGCLHAGGGSMRLVATGSNSITSADLRIEAVDGPANTPAVLISGAALAPANPANPCFGQDSGVQSMQLDGLRCVVQDILRHGLRTTDSLGSIGATTPGWGDADAFFQFAAFVSGGERQFQLFFRQPLPAVCQTGQNTSQAVSVTFVP